MKLEKTYVIGTNVMFYEIEMLPEMVQSIINAVEDVENPKNVNVEFCWNQQQYLETIDTDNISEDELWDKFKVEEQRLIDIGVNVWWYIKTNDDSFFNVAQYRRELNHQWCEKVDIVVWGETDSLFPREGFKVIEAGAKLAEANNIHRYILSFGYRKNWDSSWDVLVHPEFQGVEYVDEYEWMITHPASSKSYMTIEQMDEINSKTPEEYYSDFGILNEPKFDGSFAVISSDLIKAGVNIPHALILCAEDTSFGTHAKLIMGDQFIQLVNVNVLRVHNRRHPRKRMYIKGENNPRGFVGKQKGDWWDIQDRASKYNLSIISNSQKKFVPLGKVMEQIKKIRENENV